MAAGIAFSSYPAFDLRILPIPVAARKILPRHGGAMMTVASPFVGRH
jgi:hypothetical protein